MVHKSLLKRFHKHTGFKRFKTERAGLFILACNLVMMQDK